MSDIKRFETGPRMSQAVVHGGVVYLAGQVGTAGASVADQTKDILASIDRLLESVGSDKSKILQTTIWLASMDDFAEMNAVWDAWVSPGNAPARATGEATECAINPPAPSAPSLNRSRRSIRPDLSLLIPLPPQNRPTNDRQRAHGRYR